MIREGLVAGLLLGTPVAQAPPQAAPCAIPAYIDAVCVINKINNHGLQFQCIDRAGKLHIMVGVGRPS